MPWTAADIPDLTGKVAVVTGANSGVGYETAKALAAKSAHVVMATRNQDKAKAAFDAIMTAYPEASLENVELNLASLDSVGKAVDQIRSRHPVIDILVNNAGVMAMPERRTEDGFEMQLGVNHLGHWALTAGLMPSLLAAPEPRIVTVTSTARHTGRPIDPDNPNLEGNYSPWKAYGQAKLANFHFALGLQREFDRHSLAAKSLSAHPGLSRTELQLRTVAEGGTGYSGHFWKWMAAKAGMDPKHGALPQIRAATDPTARGGDYFAPRFGFSGPPVRRSYRRTAATDQAIDTLWDVSERLTGVSLDLGTGSG